jgi:hypothetical protein
MTEIGMQWLPKMKITNEKFQLVTVAHQQGLISSA